MCDQMFAYFCGVVIFRIVCVCANFPPRHPFKKNPQNTTTAIIYMVTFVEAFVVVAMSSVSRTIKPLAHRTSAFVFFNLLSPANNNMYKSAQEHKQQQRQQQPAIQYEHVLRVCTFCVRL